MITAKITSKFTVNEFTQKAHSDGLYYKIYGTVAQLVDNQMVGWRNG